MVAEPANPPLTYNRRLDIGPGCPACPSTNAVHLETQWASISIQNSPTLGLMASLFVVEVVRFVVRKQTRAHKPKEPAVSERPGVKKRKFVASAWLVRQMVAQQQHEQGTLEAPLTGTVASEQKQHEVLSYIFFFFL